jgi:hypothetical protein
MNRVGSFVTPDQARCEHLARRCFTGCNKFCKPIAEETALEGWKELLEKRFPQSRTGGRPFVLKITQLVKNKKTDEGLDLTGSKAILDCLAKWCVRMCSDHKIDPGSEAMQALQQHADWHEESMQAHARTLDDVAKLGDQHAETQTLVSDVRQQTKTQNNILAAISLTLGAVPGDLQTQKQWMQTSIRKINAKIKAQKDIVTGIRFL